MRQQHVQADCWLTSQRKWQFRQRGNFESWNATLLRTQKARRSTDFYKIPMLCSRTLSSSSGLSIHTRGICKQREKSTKTRVRVRHRESSKNWALCSFLQKQLVEWTAVRRRGGLWAPEQGEKDGVPGAWRRAFNPWTVDHQQWRIDGSLTAWWRAGPNYEQR